MNNNLPDYFVPTYRSLMQVPQYSRKFETKSIGIMYKYITSRIWRMTVADTKHGGYYAERFFKAAREYENGYLCAVLKDEEIADNLGIGRRYVRRMRNQLEKLGLLTYEKADDAYHSTLYLYRLGIVLRDERVSHKVMEALYIEDWVHQVQSFEKSSRNAVVPYKDLEFVMKINEVLGESGTARTHQVGTNSTANVEPPVPDRSTNNAREYVVGDDKTQTAKFSRKENDIHLLLHTRKGERRTKMENPNQPALFTTNEKHSGSYSISLSMTPTAFGRAIVKASSEGKLQQVKEQLDKLAVSEGLNITNPYRKLLPLSSFVDSWFRKNEPNCKLSTAIMVWWRMLALDLNRKDFLANYQKTMAIINKIELHNWKEFSYILKEIYFNNEKGLTRLRSLEHVSWLTGTINKNLWRVEGVFGNHTEVSDLDVLETRARIQREREKDAKILEQYMDPDAEDTASSDDYDDLLTLD